HHLRHAERTGQHAVRASNAARFARGHYSSIRRALDRIGWADFGASRRFAMHADNRSRLRRMTAINVVEMDHRVPLMRLALRTGVTARFAANASTGVDEKLHL